MRDPIRGTVGIALERAVLFVVWGLLIVPGAIWLWLFIDYFETPWRDLFAWTKAALSGTYARWLTALLWLCIALGVSLMGNVYLLLGRWWGRRSDVYHRRGARRWEAD